VEFIGMPEARIPLAQAAIYIAKAKKSNACYLAIEAAMADIEKEQTMEVPNHLKDAHYPAAKKLGHGKGYKYPHDYGGYVEQEYLPKKKTYYKPSP
jgi:putative ATPase